MRSNRDNLLFYEGDLDATLRHQSEKLASLVEAMPKDQLLATPEDRIVESVVSQVQVEPLKLYEDRMTMEQSETKIDVSEWRDRNPFGDSGPIYVHGLSITVSIPYSGDPMLWKLKPNTWQSVFPHGTVARPNRDGIGQLQLKFDMPSDEGAERIKSNLQRQLETIRFYVGGQAGQVVGFNNGLAANARTLIEQRRQRIKKHDNIADVLGIPLKHNASAPPIEALPLKRAIVKPLPPVPAGSYKPEPGIANDDYEHILKVIRHEGRTFETTPKTFAVHDEEELRDIILAHLNGHYSGGASGETFRRAGKTDIRIEDNNRAAFIAECKVWRGPKELAEAIDQLLRYLTWRDCKASIILFNKNIAGFTDLLSKVPDVFKGHPRFRKDLGQQGSGEWRYVFASQEDDLREVTVHVFLLNLYVAESKAARGSKANG